MRPLNFVLIMLINLVPLSAALGQGVRDVKIEVKVALHPLGSEQITFQSIEPLLYQYACVSCHYGVTEDPANPGQEIADIDMRSFPFGLAKLDTNGQPIYANQAALVQASMDRFRIEDPDKVMPQQPDGQPEVSLVSEEDFQLFSVWLSSGMVASPEGLPAVNDIVTKILVTWARVDNEDAGEFELSFDEGSQTFSGYLPNGRRREFNLSASLLNAAGDVVSELPAWQQRFTDREAKFFHSVDVEVIDL